jgi:hypothetical protein
VKGTPQNMKVDPYKINLNADVSESMIEIESDDKIDPDIKADVDLMWFYKKREFAR